MDLSLSKLESMGACAPGIELYRQLGCPDTVESAVALAMQQDRFNYCNWLLTHLFTKEQNVKYAIYAAKSVLRIHGSKYPDDTRPRKAIEAAEEYLCNPTDAPRWEVALSSHVVA